MRLILHYVGRYKALVLLNILSVFGFALAELGIPTVVADMIDTGVANADRGYLLRMGGVIALISVVGVAGTILLGLLLREDFHLGYAGHPPGYFR